MVFAAPWCCKHNSCELLVIALPWQSTRVMLECRTASGVYYKFAALGWAVHLAKHDVMLCRRQQQTCISSVECDWQKACLLQLIVDSGFPNYSTASRGQTPISAEGDVNLMLRRCQQQTAHAMLRVLRQ